MKPTRPVVEIICGVLARAARLHPVEVHAYCFLSNHFHLLLSVPGADRLAAFMNHLNSNLAREIGREVGWREKFWGRRYQAVLVSDEEAAQVERLLYILRHGCKENLVRHPSDWPGPNSTEALTTGKTIVGTWFDRTRAYRLGQRGCAPRRAEFAEAETLELAHLPCWRHLAPTAYRARCGELVALVEAETESRIRKTGRLPLGRDHILRQDPHAQPMRTKKRPAPFAHAATRAARLDLHVRYRRFLAAFRRASALLRSGLLDLAGEAMLFPAGCFPPPRRFVTARAST